MPNEEFTVDPEHVAGYSDLVAQTASDCWAIGTYVRDHATSDESFGRVMDLLKDPVDDYANATDSRVSDRGWTLNFTANSLQDTAWTYDTTDGGSADRFAGDNAYGAGQRYEQDLPGTVTYQVESSVTYAAGSCAAPLLVPPAEPEEADVATLVEEYAGDTVQTIDGICTFVTGLVGEEWSFMAAIIDPLVGNWNALKQKGEALVIAGEAAEAAAGNLTTSLSTLAGHWDGGAARSFQSYLTKLASALDYEGALARVVAKVYDGVAWLVEWVAIGVVKAVSLGIEILRKYAPGTGMASRAASFFGDVVKLDNPLEDIKRDWDNAKSFFNDAMEIMEVLQELPGQVKGILDVVSDPTGAMTDYSEGKLEEQFEPLKETMSTPEVDVELDDAPSKILDFGADLAEVAETDALTGAPTEGYGAGVHPRRDG